MIRSSRNAPPLGRRRRVAGVAGIAALTVIGASAASGALSPVQAETSTSALPPAAAAEVVVKPSYEREGSRAKLDATNSYATVKHLVETIGPRYNGTPQERQGASYLAEKLKPYGFEVQVQEWERFHAPPADLSATVGTLPGNPKWQLATTPRAVMTGSTAITAPVVDAGDGQDPTLFAGAATASWWSPSRARLRRRTSPRSTMRSRPTRAQSS